MFTMRSLLWVTLLLLSALALVHAFECTDADTCADCAAIGSTKSAEKKCLFHSSSLTCASQGFVNNQGNFKRGWKLLENRATCQEILSHMYQQGKREENIPYFKQLALSEKFKALEVPISQALGGLGVAAINGQHTTPERLANLGDLAHEGYHNPMTNLRANQDDLNDVQETDQETLENLGDLEHEGYQNPMTHLHLNQDHESTHISLDDPILKPLQGEKKKKKGWGLPNLNPLTIWKKHKQEKKEKKEKKKDNNE